MDYETLIHEYELGGERLRNSIQGLTLEDMLAYPVPGTWSILEIVIHLMDSDLVATDRMKRIIAMDEPKMLGYDETAFVQKLFPAEQSPADAVVIFDLNRKLFSKVLRKLPAEAFDRKGHHDERGVVTLGGMVQLYVKHLEHHLKFIVDKREMLGKLMW